MNKKIFIACALGAISLLGATSCTHDFEEINVDPNNMVVGDLHNPYGMFEPMFYDAANNQWSYYTWFWNDELAQYTAFSGGTTREEHRYKIGDSNFQSLWNAYFNRANSAQHMRELAENYNYPQAKAIALTMKVLYMENLTDIYGDIPYKEAFKARSENNMTPAYESQQQVYEDMLADLDSANALYAANSGANSDIKSMDLMYQGDMTKWRKFNNSLRLRLLCRISGRSESNAGTRVQAMLDNPTDYPIFTSNDDNATVALSGVDPYRSYFTNTLKTNFTTSAYHIAEQVIKLTVFVNDIGIQSYTDPRLRIWAVQGNDGWKGAIAGCSPSERSNSNSGAATLNHPVFCRADAPVFIMDYAEVEFILAEMALKNEISGGETAARAYYENGVRASLAKWGPLGAYSDNPVTITDEDIETYVNSELANWDNFENKQELIGNQKYLALFWTGMEAYHEIRRTGYPELVLGNGTDYNDYQYPQRFAYPAIAVANNRTNVEAALARMGGENTMKTPVWWSKQAITGEILFKYVEH